jgi:hypothetical protein
LPCGLGPLDINRHAHSDTYTHPHRCRDGVHGQHVHPDPNTDAHTHQNAYPDAPAAGNQHANA